MTALKYDSGKPPLDLLPFEALIEVSKVYGYGVAKYTVTEAGVTISGAHNWRRGMDWSRMAAACLRHIFKWMGGTDIDPESGLPHLSHAAFCLLTLVSYSVTNKGQDDRYRENTHAK